MNINTGIPGTNISGGTVTSGAGGAQGASNSATTTATQGQSSAAEVLRSMLPGDVLQGVVVSAGKEQILLKVPLHKAFPARLENTVTVSVGDRISVELTSKTQDKITFRLISLSQGGEQTQAAGREGISQGQASQATQAPQTNCYIIPGNSESLREDVELYVSKDGKNKEKRDPENVTAAVGLNTASMGRVEVILRAQGKNLNIEVRANSPEVLEHLKKNIGSLTDSIENYIIGKPTFNMIKAPLGTEFPKTEQASQIEFQGIDIRA